MQPADTPYQDALHLFVLWNFAFVQPVFDQLARNHTFLTVLRIQRASVLVATLLICLVIPTALVCIELGVRMWRLAAQRWLHSFLVGLLLVVITLPLFGRIRFLPGVVHAIASVAIGIIGAFASRRFAWVRTLLTAASPAIFAFPVWMLLISPVSRVLFPKTHPMRVSIANPAPVVLVVFDEFASPWLLDDNAQINADRFPNFAALSHEATWFRNATGVHPYTAYAVPAILTGEYQTGELGPDVVDHPVNLFTLLFAANSHVMTVFESGSSLFPDNADPEYAYPPAISRQVQNLLSDLLIVYLHHLMPLDLRMQLPKIPRRWFGLLANEDVRPDKRSGVVRYSWDRDRDQQFEHFLSCIEPSDRPRFYYLHLVLPHYPWNFLPSGRRYAPDVGLGEQVFGTTKSNQESWGSDELAIEQGAQRYLLQIGYVDRLLGRLVERLKSIGLYDDALFMVVADHGVSFRLNEMRRTPTPNNLIDLLHVPFFVKLPNQSNGRTNDRNIENIDVLPTIADFLEMTPPVQCDGHSLLDESRVDRSKKKFFDMTDLREFDPSVETWLDSIPPLVRRFRATTGWDGVFRFAFEDDVIGRDLAELNTAGRSNVEIRLDNWQGNYSDDPNTLVPCFIKGHVVPTPQPDRPVQLAIAINETVRAVTRTYQIPDIADAWSAMVPEESFHGGENTIRVFEFRTDASDRKLLECTIAGER